MAETKKKMDLLGKMTDVADVPIVEATEGFNTYKLEDGTILRVKNVATNIVRLEGVFNPLPDGRPIYLVFSSPVVNVESSPSPRSRGIEMNTEEITKSARAGSTILAGILLSLPIRSQVNSPVSVNQFVQKGGSTFFALGSLGGGYSVESMSNAYPIVPQQTTIAILEDRENKDKLAVLEKEFQELAEKWKAERRATSSTVALAMHPAYQKIIGMGHEAVPFILADLERGVDHWFWALRAITRENPVPSNSRGKMREMASAWIDWGRKNGYVG